MLSFINPVHSRQINTTIIPIFASVLYNGDSLSAAISANLANVTIFENVALDADLIIEETYNRAVSGSFLMYSNNSTLSWWRDDNATKGAYYTTFLDPIANKGDYTDFIISLTRNDNSSSQSKAAIKVAWNGYLTQLRIDFPNVKRFYLKPLMRHPTLNDATNVARWEAYRTAIYEIIDDNADVHLLTECYDLPTQDNTHLTDAAEEIEADRNGKRLAYMNGTYNKPMLGMEVTAAANHASGVLTTITHYDGTDFTIPATPDTDILFRVEYNGGQVADLSSTALSRISANQLLIETGALAYPEKLHVLYGKMHGVTNNTTPSVPKDNSPNTLPLTHSKLLITGGANAIDDITNLDFYLRPDAAKTYSSGVKVATLADGVSGSWMNWSSGNQMDFDSAAFDGLGGLTSISTNNRLFYNNGTWGNEMFIACCHTIPDTVTGSGVLLWQGGNANPTSNVQALIDSAGKLRFANNEANGIEDFGGDYRGGTYAFVFNFTSISSCDVYVYSKEGLVATHNFNPRDAYNSRTHIYYGGSCAGTTHGILLGKNQAHSVSDPSISAIAVQMLREQNSLL